ncbi:protein TIFY 10a-like [Vicia villosa]|uniref:protein TIFY 10a-like n=1 Tax=Vicia villosa TaxID=3911 RepID=UPI00273C9EC3|nr:protein TIFY 10a-like [Vicia villosa]
MNFQQLPHLFLQQIPNLRNSSVIKTSIMKEETKCAQMTIFYDGKVLVFDDVPAEKAKDIMVFSARNHVQEHPQVASTPVIYDLPMTRKASLHRFLEKRKDRIAARAPYQTSNPTVTLSKPIDEHMSWLSLAPQSPQDHKSECSSTSVLF